MKAKPTSPSFINESFRCQRRTRNGRCRMLAVDPGGKFCSEHLALRARRPPDFTNVLTRESAGFQTAQGINYSLGDLYVLLAQGRISTRRAAVLARISSTLLRTLTAIDNDQHSKAWRELGAATPPRISRSETASVSASSHSNVEVDDAEVIGTEDAATESNTEAEPQNLGESETRIDIDADPDRKPVPPGKAPLPASIDGYIEAIKKLKPN